MPTASLISWALLSGWKAGRRKTFRGRALYKLASIMALSPWCWGASIPAGFTPLNPG